MAEYFEVTWRETIADTHQGWKIMRQIKHEHDEAWSMMKAEGRMKLKQQWETYKVGIW